MVRITKKKQNKLLVLGAATSPQTLARAQIFANLGWQVTMLSPVPAKKSLAGVNIVTNHRGQGIVGKIRSILACARFLVTHKADIVHAHYAAEYGTWLAALLIRRPFVITVMGGDILFDEQGGLGKIGRWMTKFALRRANYVTAKSKLLSEVLGSFGVARERIEVIYWGVEPELFYPAPEEGAARRRQWNVPSGRRILFCPRMLTPLYNQDLLIDAMPKILKAYPDVQLVLSGFGRDETFCLQLEEQIKTAGIHNNVTITGQLERPDMPGAYNAADLIVSIPSSDGMPQSVLEAMACGKAVVIGDLDHYRELFQDGLNVCCTALHSDDIAKRIIELLGKPESVAQLAKAGIELVAQHANFQQQSRQVGWRFEQLVERDTV